MFNPIQIKHECTTVEDINTNNRINSSDNSVYPIFINQDVEYKHRQLSQFWEQSQLSNEIPTKNDIHDQQAMFQTEVFIFYCVTNSYPLCLILYISILEYWDIIICKGLYTKWDILSS